MNIGSYLISNSTYFTLDETLDDQLDTHNNILEDNETNYQSYKDELNEELKTTDRVWLEFQAGQCEQFGKVGKSILYRIVKSSVDHPENSIAAANAITILKTMQISFSCLDLSGVQIPGADLSEAILDGADLSQAHLENVNFTYASLNYVKMTGAYLKDIKCGIDHICNHKNEIKFIIARNTLLLTQDSKTNIRIWDIKTGNLKEKLSKPGNDLRQSDILFFYNDKFFINNDSNNTVTIWSIDPLRKHSTVPIQAPTNSCLLKPMLAISPHNNLLVVGHRYDEVLPKTLSWHSGTIIQFFNIDILPNKESIPTQPKENPQYGILVTIKTLFTSIFTDTRTSSLLKINQSRKEIDTTYKITEMFFSPKGTWCVTIHSEDKQEILVLHDPKDFCIIAKLHLLFEERSIIYTSYPTPVSSKYLFSSDEKLLFTVDKNTVHIWHLWNDKYKQWDLENPKKNKLFTETSAEIIELVCFNIATFALTYKDQNSRIYFRDIKANKLLHFLSKPHYSKPLSFTPNGEALFEHINSNTIAIRKIQNLYFEQMEILSGIFIKDGVFLPDSSAIRILSKDPFKDILQVYTYEINKNLTSLSREYFQKELYNKLITDNWTLGNQNYYEASLSSNGQHIISKVLINKFGVLHSTLCQNMQLINIDGFHFERYSFDCNAQDIAVSDDQQFVALLQNNQLEIWRLNPKQQLCVYNIQNLTNSKSFAAIVISHKFSLENGYVAFAIQNKATLLKLETINSDIRLIAQHTVTLPERPVPRHYAKEQTYDIRPKLQFIRNDQYLIVIFANKNRIIIWDIHNATEHTLSISANIFFRLWSIGQIDPIEISTDGTFLIACRQIYNTFERTIANMLGFYELEATGSWSLTHEQEIPRHITNIKISPNGKFFITWRKNEELCIWQVLKHSFRLFWKAHINEEARKIDIQDTKELSESNKNFLQPDTKA